MRNPTKTLQLSRTATVIGTLAALLAAPAGGAPTIADVRPPAPGVSLATVTGRDVRVAYPGEAPEEWSSVGDETSMTVEPGTRIDVRGWRSTCSVRDGTGTVLIADAGLLSATCAVPPAAGLLRTAAPAAGPGAGLQLAPDGPAAGYDRSEFGDGWARTAPGCDTRDAVLARDLTATTVRRGCDVTAGTLHDPYTGRVLTGPARALDVDHVVPLSLAWRTGAARWTAAEREEFANDPANLTTPAAAGNRAKSDNGPEEWLPAIDQCGYVTRFSAVVERYDLTVTEARRDAIEGACR
ncbi:MULTISPECIES: HNH endonuclease family protein [unclassified Pseudonocardia]|uniref:HNH endonuclease family protein n=1 Tax=unclassified Pseudonocardia TaxID=2619320 RepID=UPI0009FB491D|nr:HNH endonuclease family protein [Pseudonocardia sp. Ae406_Ps2]